MLKRIKQNWLALSVGERRRIIILGIEDLILAASLWGGFVIFMYSAAWIMEKLGIA